MKLKTVLIIDVSYLCHRAFHAMGGLAFRGRSTGALFGFFRDLLQLRKQFHPDCIAFCFDGGHKRRRAIFPDYKLRPKSTPEEDAARKILRGQMRLLRKDYLPMMGFQNIFWAKGFEADDLIASLCKRTLRDKDRGIIVGADHDLYQLLDDDVDIFDPRKKKIYTVKDFTQEFGIPPRHWAAVKAIAGCRSDAVPGIPGVGEKTALKYILGDLPDHSAAFRKIVYHPWQKNLKLVELPFDGTPKLKLQRDPEILKGEDLKGWRFVFRILGISSKRLDDLSLAR
jgi:DNA polymerase I